MTLSLADLRRLSNPDLTPQSECLVTPIGVSGADQQLRIFIEVMPGCVSDVVREAVNHIPHTCGAVDDTCGYETLNDAILDAERIGARLQGHVVAENLFFIFSQTVEALKDGLAHFPFPPEALVPLMDPTEESNTNESAGGKEDQSKNCAVILCKLRHAQILNELRAAEQQQACHRSGSDQVTWRKFHALKQCLQDSVQHWTSLFTHFSLCNSK